MPPRAPLKCTFRQEPWLAAAGTDPMVGRWNCHSPGAAPRSIARAKRGHYVTSRLVLYNLWTFRVAATTGRPPFDMGELRGAGAQAARGGGAVPLREPR
eukprot:9476759-Pyramimonas_sp.AAC.1